MCNSLYSAENRCRLTLEGIQARDDLCQLLYGNRIILSRLSEVTGLDRGVTIPTIMGRIPRSIQRRIPRSIQRRTIEKFFYHLIEELRQRWNCGDVRDSLARQYIEQRPNIRAFWECVEVDANQNAIENQFKQQMAEALMLLDYSEQSTIFHERLDAKQNHDVIAVQVHNDEGIILQQLLVKRLSKFLRGSEPHRVISTIVDGKLRNGGMDAFWNKISPYFDEPESAAPNDVIEAICTRCRTQPIIFVLYDFPKMGRHLDSLMSNFWHPLVERLAREFLDLSGRRLLLLLTGEQQSWLNVIPSMDNYLHCVLPELNQINSAHIDDWLSEAEVCQLRNLFITENIPSSLDSVSSRWNDRTYGALDAMELLCEACNLPGGLEQFKQYWQLSGDL